jgi:biopolymer transport protein ExbD
MTEKRRFLDLWVLELNKVYTEVPFATVADWVQQGRLLEDDMIKPSGTAQWYRLGDSADFAPYLPQPEPLRPDDQAEALAPVGLDFHWKKPHEEEDEDVDMIPLIDVSLVLLIFFMMTAATVAAASNFVTTPEAIHGGDANKPQALRVDISQDADGDPVYAVGRGNAAPAADDSDITDFQVLLGRLKAQLADAGGPVELVINAHKDLKAKYARDLLLALRAEPFRSKITVNFYGVSEREP